MIPGCKVHYRKVCVIWFQSSENVGRPVQRVPHALNYLIDVAQISHQTHPGFLVGGPRLLDIEGPCAPVSRVKHLLQEPCREDLCQLSLCSRL